MSNPAHVPILSPVTRHEHLREFRERKLELKRRDYPLDETRAFVSAFLPKVIPNLQGRIDKNTLLVRVPSGSGTNMVTILFQQALAQQFGAGELPAHLVMKLHKAEAKNNLQLEQRNEDPIRYHIQADRIKAFATRYQQIVIVDDVIGSGESCVRLRKELEKSGLPVYALVSLATVEKNYPKPGDIERVLKKLTRYLALGLPQVVIVRKELQTVFADYTRQKLNRFEKRLLSTASAKTLLLAVQRAAQVEAQFSHHLRHKMSPRL